MPPNVSTPLTQYWFIKSRPPILARGFDDLIHGALRRFVLFDTLGADFTQKWRKIKVSGQFVLSDLLSDENFSEKTHKAIAKEFSLDPYSVNGAALISALNSANEAGQVLYASENKLALGDGLEAYTNQDGQGVITVETADGVLELMLEPDTSPTDLGLKLSLLKIWRATGDKPFFHEDLNPHSAFISGANRYDLDRMQCIFAAVLGGNGQYNGEVLTDDLTARVVALNSLLSDEGNAAALKLVQDKNGYVVNIETLAMMALFIANQPSADQVDLDTLRDHLALVCPKNVQKDDEAVTQANEAPDEPDDEDQPVTEVETTVAA